MRQEIGGMRLGSGSKLSVEMHNYQRSTHDLGYIFRSSMAPGTLVPFMVQVGLPGDTFDINLNAAVLTHPTLGPLFGSFKVQLDVFEAPARLYVPALMQNTLGIGNNMAQISLPQIETNPIPPFTIINGSTTNPDNIQINPSALMSYLGVRGWGNNQSATPATKFYNAVPLLAYWEIYKNYYANKQELIGAFLLPPTNTTQNITGITSGATAIPEGTGATPIPINPSNTITITYGAGNAPDLSQIIFTHPGGAQQSARDLTNWTGGAAGPSTWVSVDTANPTTLINNWNYAPPNSIPNVSTFPLSNIDAQKTLLMQWDPMAQFLVTNSSVTPYGECVDLNITPGNQCGLALKTYQSDLLQNWMNSTWISNVITSTAIDTSTGSFTVDSLILARKVYELLNRIAVTGGSYNDWINAAYAHEPMSICISPIYHGGLSKELVFQEVVSTVQNANLNQPLGTLAGRGTMHKKHKGGQIHIKVSEPTYIIGIVSLTPRLDYSQGNTWDMSNLHTMDDFHKPALDQIGFQDLLTEQMAWWSSYYIAGTWNTPSAGKQPAWINYMTSINRCYGNFADANNEMFMTLNRRYQCDTTALGVIQDLTTYINPSHYNFIFAQTSLDAQNFWTQIAVDITARRKMSAKVMPNL